MIHTRGLRDWLVRKMRFKLDDRVAVYGFGLNSTNDFHNGCKGSVSQISVANDCERREVEIVGVIFDDNSFDWFSPNQLRRLVKKK